MSETGPTARSGIETKLLDELEAMVSYALGSGLTTPDSAIAVAMEVQHAADGPLDAATLARARAAHEALSRAVAPATPQALDLLDDEAHRERRFPWLPSLGPVSLVRQLTAAGLLFLVGFVLLGLSSDVSRTSGGILDSSGGTLLLNLLFVLSASGLGAVFAALFKVNQFIAKRTYDPIYESSYWVNIVLGLIGGLLLAELLLEVLQSGDGTESSGLPFARPLLALVGGFSAKVVFQILNRLVEAVGSVFKGDTTEIVESRTEAAQARLLMQQTEDRVKLSTKLVQLQQSLNSGVTPEQLSTSVNAMLDDLLPYDTTLTPVTEPSGDGAAVPATSDPGTSDPAVSDPGVSDPATSDPGPSDPGASDPGASDPGVSDPGVSDPAASGAASSTDEPSSTSAAG